MILRRFVWFLGVLLALGGAWLLLQGGRAATATTAVLETRVAIPKNTVISASMLQIAHVPADAVNVGADQVPSNVIGQRLTVYLPSGQQILPQWLASANTALGKSYVSIPISINASEAAAGTLLAGERVSLLWLPGGLVNQPPVIEFLHHPLTILSVQDGNGNVISGPGVSPNIAAGPPAIVDLRVLPTQATSIESQMNSGKMIVVGIAQGGKIP